MRKTSVIAAMALISLANVAFAWTVEGNLANASFGESVASAGDVNGDGYSDVIVGARVYDNSITGGRVVLYLGSASGVSSVSSWTASGNQAGAYFGQSVASAGDVNNDGYSDVIIGAPFYDNGESNEGRAFLYLGSAAGLSSNPAWVAEVNQTQAMFGSSVSPAGDMNGDGYSDVLVGASSFSNGELDEGRVYLYLGTSSGLSVTAAGAVEGNQAYSHFGASLACAGDVNQDGYSDILIGAPDYDNGQVDEGRAFLYMGGSVLPTSPVWTAESDQAGADFGASVASAGDMNGDGYSDVAIGSPNFDNGQIDEGRVYVYLGSSTGLSNSAVGFVESNQPGALFGFSVNSVGDFNNDGYSDLAIGAPFYDNGQTDEGQANLYMGSAIPSTLPMFTVDGNQVSAGLGYSVSSAGDTNNDGYDDIIIGAPGFDNGQVNEGQASLYFGLYF